MRVIFFGIYEFGLHSLQSLVAAGYTPVALVTKAAVGSDTPPIVEFAEQHGIPVLQPESPKLPWFLEKVTALTPDLSVVAGYHKLIPGEVLSVPTHGTINVHGSLLPRYRGPSTWKQAIMNGEMPPALVAEMTSAYESLAKEYGPDPDVAVRSSATAEDLPTASFAGQQDTFLNIRGLKDLLFTCRRVFASLYNDRAISYRVHHGFAHDIVALSIGVQKMVRSDLGASGVMFTLDTETGFRDVVFITSAYGLGENVVQGAVNPDEFYVFKPMLAAGKQPILKRHLGSKAIKMVYAEDKGTGHTIRNVDVP